jgi:hypothetical protein
MLERFHRQVWPNAPLDDDERRRAVPEDGSPPFIGTAR